MKPWRWSEAMAATFSLGHVGCAEGLVYESRNFASKLAIVHGFGMPKRVRSDKGLCLVGHPKGEDRTVLESVWRKGQCQESAARHAPPNQDSPLPTTKRGRPASRARS